MSNFVVGPQLIEAVPYNSVSLEGLNEFAEKRGKEYAGQTKRLVRVVGFCMLIKREVVEKIGGLDSRYGLGNFEDDDFSLRTVLAGYGSCIAKDCFIHHFGNRTFEGANINYHESLKITGKYSRTNGITGRVTLWFIFFYTEPVKGRFYTGKTFLPS